IRSPSGDQARLTTSSPRKLRGVPPVRSISRSRIPTSPPPIQISEPSPEKPTLRKGPGKGLTFPCVRLSRLVLFSMFIPSSAVGLSAYNCASLGTCVVRGGEVEVFGVARCSKIRRNGLSMTRIDFRVIHVSFDDEKP